MQLMHPGLKDLLLIPEYSQRAIAFTNSDIRLVFQCANYSAIALNKFREIFI